MKKELAKAILERLRAFNPIIDDLARLNLQIDDEAELLQVHRNIGKIMQILSDDLYAPLVAQYPDLEPDEELRKAIVAASGTQVS